MTALAEFTRAFRAMNTDVNAAVVAPGDEAAGAAAALDGVEACFRSAEERFSRFRADSELAALNRAGGRPFPASRELYDIVAAGLDLAARTDGRFDPSVLPGLVAAGYDRSFETLTSRPAAAAPSLRRPTWREVKLDAGKRTVTLPRDGGLDLGGIGKGWTADRAALALRQFDGFVVDAGGDIVAGGTQADGSPWTIGIADPFEGSRDLAVITLRDGAVCTSSTLKRRWESGGGEAHHIIDPGTGAPAASGVVAATVQAAGAAIAEALAKAAIVAGERGALALITDWPGAAGFIVLENGQTRYTDGFAFA